MTQVLPPRTLDTRFRRGLKMAAAAAVHYSGVLGAYRARVMRGKAVVLLYHRILGPDDRFPDYAPYGMSVRRETFERHLAFVARRYRVLGLAEMMVRLSSGEDVGDRPLCAITFDDGWRDNYTLALPLLRRYRLPATVFVATGYVNGGVWFWEERVKFVLGHIYQRAADSATADEARSAMVLGLGRAGLSGFLDVSRMELAGYLTALVTRCRASADERARVLHELEALMARPDLALPPLFLGWPEAREMIAAGIEFGAHTVSHPSLDKCSPEEAEAEISASKAEVERQLGCSVISFAYPYGKHSDTVTMLAAKAGLRWAFTTRPGMVAPGDEAFRLKRIDIYEDVASTTALFACRIVRFMDAF